MSWGGPSYRLRRRGIDVVGIEGDLSPDGNGAAVIDPCTGTRIKLRFGKESDRALARSSPGRRAAISGPGLIGERGGWIRVESIEVFPPASVLPRFGPGDPGIDITGGIPSEDYVRALRDDEDGPSA